MIGQSVINVSSGGRGRLSTLWAGAFLLFLIVVLGPYVAQIPMAALVAVMIMVAINTFQWRVLPHLGHPPTLVELRHARHRGGGGGHARSGQGLYCSG